MNKTLSSLLGFAAIMDFPRMPEDMSISHAPRIASVAGKQNGEKWWKHRQARLKMQKKSRKLNHAKQK